MASTITFFPLGNADSSRIDLPGGEKLLFDFADLRAPDDPSDRRIRLGDELLEDLKAAKRTDFDVVAFTHLDADHVTGAPAFFHLEHAVKYQSADRIKIRELWVPAAAILEGKVELCEDAKIIQAEARHRLKTGRGIRVFSRPTQLSDWLRANGLTIESRRALFSDAGTVVPGWQKETQGVEFFVHSPFGSRLSKEEIVDRNADSLVFQAVFQVKGQETKVWLGADTPYEMLEQIIETTEAHGRHERLHWDLLKLPHHCSYTSLGPEKGDRITVPTASVARFFEHFARQDAIIVSTSLPIPTDDSSDQPPHRQAANYYREKALPPVRGTFVVTMEHPTVLRPAPLVVSIDELRATIVRDRLVGAAAIISRPAPRAGTNE